MRIMLISLKKEVYEKVVSGEKIYEHRKVFPNEAVKAYVYVSSPTKAICGIMYLNNRTHLLDWKEKYKDDEHAIQRIDSYLLRYKYAMEITKFENTNKITLDKLKQDLEKFVVPQMYYFIEGTDLLEYLERNLKIDGLVITHEYDNITSDKICKS